MRGKSEIVAKDPLITSFNEIGNDSKTQRGSKF